MARPLDGAHRSRRADGDHQDPPATTCLRSGGTAHPLGAPPPCICSGAGPGKTSSVAPSLDCEPCHLLPDGGNQPADLTHQLTERPQTRARPASERLLLRPAPHRGAPHHHRRPSTDADCPKSTGQSRLHASHIPFQYRHRAVRWIRA